MKQILLWLTIAITLSACSKKPETITIPVPVEIHKVRPLPPKYLDCKRPNLDRFDSANLTDAQNAEILYQYDYELNNCYFDIKAIKKIQSQG
jgi:hypothetical protein